MNVRGQRAKIDWSIIRKQISYTRAEFRKVRRAVRSYTWENILLAHLLQSLAEAKALDLKLKEIQAIDVCNEILQRLIYQILYIYTAIHKFGNACNFLISQKL